jgi:hypothetical protein
MKSYSTASTKTELKPYQNLILNLPVGPTTGMAQTGRLTHGYGVRRVCAMWVCLVAAVCGAQCPQRQQLNPPIW